MGENSGIEWTHHTFNPWWGCQRVSPGCENCYAEALDHRLKPEGVEHWGPTAVRKGMAEGYWNQPLRWNEAAQAAGEPHRVFCASMADVFERLPRKHPSSTLLDLWRLRLWKLIEATPNLVWLLLTKRIENAAELLPWKPDATPWRNVWVGTTVEDQKRADERLPILKTIAAARRFISYEPALEPVELDLRCPRCGYGPKDQAYHGDHGLCRRHPDMGPAGFIDWVIAGAESGFGARPADDNWFREVRDQCKEAGTAFFLKQKARGGKKISLPELDGVQHTAIPEAA